MTQMFTEERLSDHTQVQLIEVRETWRTIRKREMETIRQAQRNAEIARRHEVAANVALAEFGDGFLPPTPIGSRQARRDADAA